MDAFKVIKDGKVLDYRVGQNLNLDEVKTFFSIEYEVLDLKQGPRHVHGSLKKDDNRYFLKIATTEGISQRTKTEKIWNDEFNNKSTELRFKVPKNIKEGEFNGLYYLISENFDGQKLAEFESKANIIDENFSEIIDFSEHIQSLDLNIPINDAIQDDDHRSWFRKKTRTWFDSVPQDRIADIEPLWKIVEQGSEILERKVRHGDFTPWHLLKSNDALILLDGEHAHSNGVEYYDISYFIQRVHSILELPELAQILLNELIKRGYDRNNLRTVLASRAIGGFLDESFKPNPDYKSEREFASIVINY